MHDGDDRPHAARQEPAPGSQGSSCLLVPHFERPTEPQKQKDAKPGNEKTARLIHRWHTLRPRRGMAGRSMTPHTSARACTCAAAPTDRPLRIFACRSCGPVRGRNRTSVRFREAAAAGPELFIRSEFAGRRRGWFERAATPSTE